MAISELCEYPKISKAQITNDKCKLMRLWMIESLPGYF